MAKKPARKSRPDANGSAAKPAKAIEPKPDRRSNPLLTDPAIHADLKPLLDALVSAAGCSFALADSYRDLLALKAERGLPQAREWPEVWESLRPRLEHSRAASDTPHADARPEEPAPLVSAAEPDWTRHLREWGRYFRDWCAAIAAAKQAAKSPAVAALMDAGEARPAHRWTTRTSIDLDNLAAELHPAGAAGVDGLGLARCGLPPLPQEFRTHAEAVCQRIDELRSIQVSAVPSSATGSESPDVLDRLQRAAAAADPGAIDRAAERAAEKVARVFGGDDADAKPDRQRPKLPSGDDGEYRPATWFRKGMADRLRQAASKNRKTKRVATRTVDGVVCYSVADSRRWWPNDVPKEA